jgi:hypothetical protein
MITDITDHEDGLVNKLGLAQQTATLYSNRLHAMGVPATSTDNGETEFHLWMKEAMNETVHEDQISEAFEMLEPCGRYLIHGCDGLAEYRVTTVECPCGLLRGSEILLCGPCTRHFNRPDGETTCGTCFTQLGTARPLRRRIR